ncbi:MAG: glycosyltransferase family 39 protein [Candidatus Liptonbacteria bacterium]|nr:glycosyltransferase family 39 protein [Candidatus Liptonbacteria bacterium]
MEMTTRKTFLLLLLILIIASFLRLYHITTVPPGLYPDEAMNGTNALQAINSGNYKVFYPDNNGREGLFINIQALFLKFFGVNEPWVLRLPSAIFGTLTVLGIYFLAKELFTGKSTNSESNTNLRIRKFETNSLFAYGNAVALLSAFFLATSFWHINFSHIGFRAIMAPFFLVWALYFLLKAMRALGSTYYLLPTTYSIIGGIFYGLGFYSYISYRVTPILILFVLLFYWLKNKDFANRKKILHSAFYFLLFTFIVALPIGFYFLQHPADFMGRTTQVSVFSSVSPLKDLAMNTVKTLGMFNFAGDGNWRHNYAGSPELFWPVGLLFILGIIIGIKGVASTKHEILNSKQITNYNNQNSKVWSFRAWNLFKISNLGFLILFLWFFLAMLPVVISNEGIPHALRSILMIPPVIILAGIGGVAAYDFIKKYVTSFWLPLATTAFLAILIFQGYYSYFVAWANNPNVPGAFAADYVALGRKLNNLPINVPKYVVVQAGGTLVNGIPMPAQTVMFITDTFTPEGQKAKNIHYVLPSEEKNIPVGAEIFYIK